MEVRANEHEEDLAQLNGGSGSSEHLVWGHRARQGRQKQGPTGCARLMQVHVACIRFAA